MRKSRILPIFLAFWLWPSTSHALEGDWELGGDVAAFLMPHRDLYGGGGEFIARYSVLDGLSVGAGFGIYGARQTTSRENLALFQLNLGVHYALDVLEWIPGVGVQFSSLFDDSGTFHRDGHGLAVDFEAFVQYRGFRQIGIAIFFRYALVFVDDDFMTVGLRFSWFSGLF